MQEVFLSVIGVFLTKLNFMKKILAICAFLTMTSGLSQAAPSSLAESQRERGFAADKLANAEENQRPLQMRQRQEDRMKNASPEEKARMERHREIMKGLTSAQREEVKKEMERHRAEMKKITGHDLVPSAPMPKEGGAY